MITPYLTFNGNCKEALAFYRSVFPCGEPSILPYGDYMPEGSPTPPELLRGWVMHAEMTVCGTNVWFADSAQSPGNSGLITLSAIVPTEGKRWPYMTRFAPAARSRCRRPSPSTVCFTPWSGTGSEYPGRSSPRKRPYRMTPSWPDD